MRCEMSNWNQSFRMRFHCLVHRIAVKCQNQLCMSGWRFNASL